MFFLLIGIYLYKTQSTQVEPYDISGRLFIHHSDPVFFQFVDDLILNILH